jgi:hypothetical protein
MQAHLHSIAIAFAADLTTLTDLTPSFAQLFGALAVY